MNGLPTWIHVGLPKTGTTTLQQVIFPRHEEILYCGKFVTEELNELSHLLTAAPRDRFDARQAAAILDELKSRRSSRHRVCAYSEELLSYARQLPPQLGAKRLKQLFSDARILLVLRNPFEWLQSIYFFNLKRRKPEALKGFNEWLAAELAMPLEAGELATLAIDRLSEAYFEQFGDGAVEALFYEDFRSDAERFLERLSAILGVDPGATIGLYKSSPRRRFNLRLTTGQEEFCRKFELVAAGRHRDYVREIMPFIEQLPPDQRLRATQMLPPDHSSDAIVSRRLRALSRFIDGAAYAELSRGEAAAAEFDPALYGKIRERVEGGYRRAASMLGVNVEQYFGDPADHVAPVADAEAADNAVAAQRPGNLSMAYSSAIAGNGEQTLPRVGAVIEGGHETPCDVFDLLWEKLHLAANATGRNCNSRFVELYLSVCCELEIGASFEIGAFEASFSKELKRRKPDLAAYAFEANGEVFRRFRGGMPEGVTYLNEAIGSENGVCTFHIPVAVAGKDGQVISPRRGNIRTSSLYAQSSADVEYESITSKCSTLDSWQEKLGWPASALWIDVEGAAREVLMGAKASMQNGVQCVAIELEKRSFWRDQWLASDVAAFMAGFDFAPLARDMETGWQYNQIFMRRTAISKSVLKRVGKYIDALLHDTR